MDFWGFFFFPRLIILVTWNPECLEGISDVFGNGRTSSLGNFRQSSEISSNNPDFNVKCPKFNCFLLQNQKNKCVVKLSWYPHSDLLITLEITRRLRPPLQPTMITVMWQSKYKYSSALSVSFVFWDLESGELEVRGFVCDFVTFMQQNKKKWMKS